MSTSIRFTCDCGCGAEKKETNHWWMVYGYNHTDLRISVWDEPIARLDATVRLCAGRECVQKIIERWLEKQ